MARLGLNQWRLWQALFSAIEEVAPEILSDLAELLPQARKTREELQRFYGQGVLRWAALEPLTQSPSYFHEARAFAQALESWARRWKLYHAEVLEWALIQLEIWLDRPHLIGKMAVGTPILFSPPEFPTFEPPPWKPLDKAPANDYLRKLDEAYRAYRAQVAAILRKWEFTRKELYKHARWLALRLKGLNYSHIADLEEEPVGEDAIRRGVKRLAKELGLNL